MKSKYTCPQCPQMFSRNWNMREHCRTQHNYDPDPILRPSPGGRRNTTQSGNFTLSDPAEKFLKMMAGSRFQQTGIMDATDRSLANSNGSIESALEYLLENFVIVRKKEFHGISGYFCRQCLTFEYRYIRNIWDEIPAKKGHLHKSSLRYDANRQVKELEGLTLANRQLIELTNSLFGNSRILEVLRCQPDANFHGPVITFNSLNPYEWAGIAIISRVPISSTSFINEFITNVEGTYAQIIVDSGPLSGMYLMSIRPVG